MKKFSFLILSILFVCAGVFFVACDSNSSNAKITLNTTNVAIYLGETENNSVMVNAKPEGVNVNSLSLVYDTSYIKISQSEKLSDGSFNLIIQSKVSIGTQPIEVEVKAGNSASAKFHVEIILPVESIVANDNVYVAYNGGVVRHNLLSDLTFYPSGTKQTGVEFSLLEENENVSIDGNYLVVRENANFNFADGANVKVNAVSTVEGKSAVAVTYNVAILPNASLLASNIQVSVDDGSAVNPIDDINYELTISQGAEGYELSTFILTVTIPTALDIEVDLNSTAGNVLAPNILSILSYSKSLSKSGLNDVYTFTFEANSATQGEGYLYLKYRYKNYPNDELLSASFICGQTAGGINSLLEKVKVSVLMPITDIQVSTDAVQTVAGYTIYKNYNGELGTKLIFNAVPFGTIQSALTLTKNPGSLLEIFDANGNLLEFVDNKCTITSGEILYIKGGDNAVESLICSSATPGKESISLTVDFSVIDGASQMGFVAVMPNDGEMPVVQDEITLYTEVAQKVSAIIYAPGAKEDLTDFIFEGDVTLSRMGEAGSGYFSADFQINTVGTFYYTISTINGFAIIATINVINPITEVNVDIKTQVEYTAGIGQVNYEDNSLINIAIQNGYSVELAYKTNANAEIISLAYSFYEPSISIYDIDAINGLKNVTSPTYENDKTFMSTSSIISTQNITRGNLISGIKAGIVVVKIEVYGYKAQEGKMVLELKDTKYLFVEIYSPVKEIVSTGKNLTLRAKNQVDTTNYNLTEAELSLNVMSLAGHQATYGNIYIDGGKYQFTQTEGGEKKYQSTITLLNRFDREDPTKNLFTATYDYESKVLKISVNYIDATVTGTYQVRLFAGDFATYVATETGTTTYCDNDTYATYVISLTIVDTKLMSEINVSNLKLDKTDDTSKTYETIYIDTSKSSNVTFKLATEVLPIDAFDKNLTYNYIPNSGSTQAMVDVAEDGTITVLGEQGGSGRIEITPTYNSNVTVKKVIVPIVVSDGNSWQTAYQITSLDEIIDANKHYVLTIPTTYILTDALFNTFKGGLYGRTYENSLLNNGEMATVMVQNCSLFNTLEAGAKVQDLYVCGYMTTRVETQDGVDSYINNGFVAGIAKTGSLVSNVKVTSYVSNGIYVPSTITVSSGFPASVGGIVGVNNGQVVNCIFAGSINKANNPGATVNAIVGNGSSTGSKFIIAKYKESAGLDKVYADSKGNFVNGIITNIAGQSFNDTGVIAEKYEDYEFADGKINVKDYKNAKGYQSSYGKENSSLGLVFYYEALNEVEKYSKILAEYNRISLNHLLNIETVSPITSENLRVIAKNLDGSVCNFVTVSSTGITIKGIGQFKLYVTSEYDYTLDYELNILSLYYTSDFTIEYNGTQLEDSDTLNIVDGQTRQIVSKINNIVKVEYETETGKFREEFIELKTNNFGVNFEFENGEEASKFITNNKLGTHTINMTSEWLWDKTNVTVALEAIGYDVNFNLLINEYFSETEDQAFVGKFAIEKKEGTKQIVASVSEGSIEPNDYFSFEATLTTDTLSDKITIDTISVFTAGNFPVDGDYFIVLEPERLDKNNNGTTNDDTTFKITIGINYKEIGSETLLSLVNRDYYVVVKAQSEAVGSDVAIYEAMARVKLTLLPQTISTINTILYKVTSSTPSGVAVENKETPTSVILPSEYGFMVVDMYPSYASYDYLEVVATSNTTSRLSFRLQEKVEDKETHYKTATRGFESIEDKNGIRILNNDDAVLDQSIGRYYIKMFVGATFDADTIFTITVNAYHNGNKLSAQSVFTLYVRAPEAPELSLNGETRVYALAGQNIEGISVKIAEDQINARAYIATNADGSSVLDGGTLSQIEVVMANVSTNEQGYKLYNISVIFGKDYNIRTDSTRLKLIVESTKISNGKQIVVSSEMYIYIVDYIPKSNDIVIYDTRENIVDVTSIKAIELKLADVLDALATKEFKDTFNAQGYFANEHSGFKFGSNSILTEEELLNKANVLASYLSFINGSEKTPLLFRNSVTGELELNSHDFCSFDIIPKLHTPEDGEGYYTYHLYVRGGDYTGSVQMVLEIPYQMPDGRIFTYEYNFEILNSIYTTEDFPTEIANVADFLAIEEQDLAKDYILTNDLNLYDFTAIANTEKISSLDGNNHTINIRSFAEVVNGTANFALFNQISVNTTIKNLTVNLYYLSELQVSGDVPEVKVAGFAIQNNGIISNCEVSVYQSANDAVTTTAYGIKLNENFDAEIAGFVLTNNGSITNSRVGSDNKLVTNIKYNVDESGFVTNTDIIKTTKQSKNFTIKASGTISGFVGTNSGVIASSFVKNINIKNTYFKQETRVTAGFVNENSGVITLSYAQGAFANETDIYASVGGLEGSGILSGFVYLNTNTITDCYSNLMITNTRDQVGRLGAGFVFNNTESGIIERSYSASKVVSNNITQMNFAGITDFGGYNNSGIIRTSYYYTKENTDIISIESVLNTSITAISDFTYLNNFYGFSFEKNAETTGSKSESKGTWEMTSRGPAIVSANNIAHSLREKRENPDALESEIPYYFIYCEGFELGSVNNPIIIRNAEEFNKVFGGSTSTEIKKNFDLGSGKIYGAYRIVDNIDMLELVPKEEQETEFKVNLLSTNMTLTGEKTNSGGRNGSLDGNGLTISNISISNASTSSQSFGLFKSIENSASICNLNIEVASGGVSADHTVFVGTIAGSLKDSWAYNINIKAIEKDQYTQVIGANITGGAFGLVSGDSVVSNINLTNMSVTSTYNELVSFGGNISEALVGDGAPNMYNRTSPAFNQLSIAGGVFGVLDIYTQEEIQGKKEYGTTDYLAANTLSVSTNGGIKVEGMTVGGIAGYIGKYVVARDLLVTIVKDALPVKLTSYSCYAGGIAGYSEGNLYQVRIEHENAWQTQIEENIYNYYNEENSEAREQIDRGQMDIFESEVGYRPYVVGGLIGVARGGRLNIAYSKINVIATNSKYIGGAIGVVCEPTVQEAEDGAEVVAGDNSLKINEVYVTGDVFSKNNENYFVGGLIAHISDASITISKFNAMNYWGYQAYEKFVSAKTEDAKSIHSVSPSLGAGVNIDYSKGDIYSIKEIEFKGKDSVTIDASGSEDIMQSYFNYPGVQSDNGAQIDLMFREKNWYLDGNWSRDVNETFPHILFVTPELTYTIASTSDFYKFANYGADEKVTFVVIEMVDCEEWQATYGLIRADIIGLTSDCGFKNLKVPLFSEFSGNKMSNLKFIKNQAAIVQKSVNAQFFGLIYEECDFQKAYSQSVAGVTYVVSSSAKFSNISFEKCTIKANNATNAGFLFGTTVGAAGSLDGIQIENIKLNQTTKIEINKIVNPDALNPELNYGMLFGKSHIKAKIASVTFDAQQMAVNLNEQNQPQEGDGAYTHTGTIKSEVSVGLLVGYASDLTVFLNAVAMNSSATLSVNLTSPDTVVEKDYDLSLFVGGLVGRVGNELKLTDVIITPEEGEEEVEVPLTNVYYSPSILIGQESSSKMQDATNLWVGTLTGYVTTLNVDTANYLYSFGYVPPQNGQQAEYKKLSAKLVTALDNKVAQANGDSGLNYIGGICGQVSTIVNKASEEDTPKPLSSYLAYYGDMLIESDFPNATAYIGGCYGMLAEPSGEAEQFIENTYFEGTISFAGATLIKKNASEEGEETPAPVATEELVVVSAGGVIGYIDGTTDTTVTIANSISSGEILLTNSNGAEKEEINLGENSYVGGLFGYTDANVKFGTDDQEISDSVAIITTIFATSEYSNVDAIGTFAADCKGTVNLYHIPETTTYVDKLQYTSTLTFSVSKAGADNNIYKYATGARAIPSNNTYNQLFSASGILSIINENAAKGSKVTPYETSEPALDNLPVGEDGVNTPGYYKKAESNVVTYESKYIRKLYIKAQESTLKNQISLKNTVMFSDGEYLYSYFTPFNLISANSAVSGLVAKVYIDFEYEFEDGDEMAGLVSSITSTAGFANQNDGIIYTCAVQETLDELMEDGNAIFEAYLHFNKYLTYESGESPVDSGRVAGFVTVNNGKIFGSNANISIGYEGASSDSIKVSSFVGYNLGNISYSYVTGTNRGADDKTAETSYPFAPDTTIVEYAEKEGEESTSTPQGIVDNCYSITKMKNSLGKYTDGEGLNLSTSKVDSDEAYDVYYEHDANETIGVINTELYGMNAKDGINDDSEDAEVLGDYFLTDKNYNNNYPTLSNVPFQHFTYLKRSSYVAYDNAVANYVSIDPNVVYDTPNTSVGETINDTVNYLFKGITAKDTNLKEVTWFYTIPNLTILKKLYVSGESGIDKDSLLCYTSKFVISANINVGYTCDENSYITETYVKKLGNYVSLTNAEEITANKTAHSAKMNLDLQIDGYNNSLDNLYLKECNLIETIEAGTIKRIKISNIKLQRTNGIIGTTYHGVDLSEIRFVSTNASDSIFVDPDGNSTAGATGVSAFASAIGILVGLNGGTIQNCNMTSFIYTPGTALYSYSLGGLVGENTGTIKNCTISSTVSINEDSMNLLDKPSSNTQETTIIFGGLVAINSGEISSCQLKSGQSVNYALTGGGTVYINKVLSEFSGVTENNSSEKVLVDAKGGCANPIISPKPDVKDMQEGDEITPFNAQIYVANKGVAIVGGIVGTNNGGAITATFANEAPIYVGNEITQIASYVGGIAGVVKAGTLIDCSNKANIGAMAIWFFTQSSEASSAYTFDASGMVVKVKNVEANSDIGINYGATANTTVTAKYDGNKLVYAYKEMSSLAYAGGIAGFGLKAESEKLSGGSERLVNSGTITGGYRAVKPVAQISAQSKQAELDSMSNTIVNYWVGIGISAVVYTVIKANSDTWGNGHPIIKAILETLEQISRIAVSLLIKFLNTFISDTAIPAMARVNLTINGYFGNSTDYYDGKNIENLIFGSTTNMVNYINNAIYSYATKGSSDPNRGITTSSYWEIGANRKDFSEQELQAKGFVKYADKFVGGGLERLVTQINMWNSPSDLVRTVIFVFLGMNPNMDSNYVGFEFDENTNTCFEEIIRYEKVDLAGNKTPLDMEVEINNYSTFKEYVFDGICSSITSGEEEKLNVYSFTKSYNSGSKNTILATGNFNKKAYTGISDKYSKSEEDFALIKETIESWNGGDTWSCVDEGNKHFEPVNSRDYDLGFDTSVEHLEYTLTSIGDWEKLVYTINSNIKVEPYIRKNANRIFPDNYLELSEEEKQNYYAGLTADAKTAFDNEMALINTTINKYLNMTIIIRLMYGEGSIGIEVSDDVLNKFNGSIISQKSYEFFNLVLKTSTSSSSGLIKESEGVTLKNISIARGITVEAKSGTNASIGVLIGKLNNKESGNIIDINSINIKDTLSIVEDSLTDVSISYINTLGVVIGEAHLSDSESTNSLKDLRINLPNFTIDELNIAEGTNKALGVVVGKVHCGYLNVIDTKTEGKLESSSSFNRVGTFAGEVSVAGKLKIGSINSLNMSVMATANANTYVGGYVGYNEGSIELTSNDKVGDNCQTIFAADVSKSIYSAFVGGIVGGNAGVLNASTISIDFGTKMEKGYDKVDYLLAGYNMVNLTASTSSFPKQANVNIITNELGGSNVNVNASSVLENNLIKAYIQEPVRNAGWPNSSLIGSKSNVEWTDYSSQGISSHIKVQNVGGVPSLTFKQENKFNKPSDYSETQTEGDVTVTIFTSTKTEYSTDGVHYTTLNDGETTYKKEVRLSYEYQNVANDTYVSSKLDGVVQQQKILSLNYYEYEEAYKTALTAGALTRTYKLLVRLVNTNAKIDQDGRYTLQIVKLNDYTSEAEERNFWIKTTSTATSNQGHNGSEQDITQATYLYKKYTEVKNVNEVIYSKSFELASGFEDTFVNPWGVSLEAFLSKETESGSGTNKIITVDTTNAELKSTNFRITCDGAVKISEDYEWSVSEKTITTTSDSSTSSDPVESEGNYTLEIITFGSDANPLPTGSIEKDSGVTGRQHINPADDKLKADYKVTVEDISGNTKTATGKFSEDVMVNATIQLPYSQPRFVFDPTGSADEEYDRISVSDYVGPNGGRYLIVTCYKEVEAENVIREYIYKKTSNKLQYCGYITYKLIRATTDGVDDFNASFNKLYGCEDGATPCRRYESFFPTTASLNAEGVGMTVSTISSDIKPIPTATSISQINVTYYYYNAVQKITVGKTISADNKYLTPYYVVDTQYEMYSKKIVITNSSTTIDSTGTEVTNDAIIDKYPSRVNDGVSYEYVSGGDIGADGKIANGLFNAQTYRYLSDGETAPEGVTEIMAVATASDWDSLSLSAGTYVIKVAKGAGGEEYLETILSGKEYAHYYLLVTVASDGSVTAREILGYYYEKVDLETASYVWYKRYTTDGINYKFDVMKTDSDETVMSEEQVMFYIVTGVNTDVLNVAVPENPEE